MKKIPADTRITIKGRLTLRDWFAAQALTGIQQWDAIINGKNAQFAKDGAPRQIAKTAYMVADAMLSERCPAAEQSNSTKEK